MKELPILFSGPMVRAILDGRKTQTRRIVNPQPPLDELGQPAHGKILGPERFEPVAYDRHGEMQPGPEIFGAYDDYGEWGVRCPYEPGDRLYVRETWAHDGPDLKTVRAAFEDAIPACTYGPYYRATECAPDTLRWRPSIHMPKWAARIWLEVTGVRVERLQNIREADAIAEGVDSVSMADVPRQATWSRRQDFSQLWDSLNAERAPWASNPWVWVIEFERDRSSSAGVTTGDGK